MGPGIVIPLIVLAIVVAGGLTWAKRKFKDVDADDGFDDSSSPAIRLTSNALRDISSPPWRVVYEISAHKLGGIEHVLIGPGGIFAARTSMDPMPLVADTEPTPQQLAGPAIVRGELDDALARCAMTSAGLLTIFWGASDDTALSIELLPGHTAIDGHSLVEWAASATEATLTPGQVDLAWQTVTTGIGRPDPLP